ncbi:MAG: amidohydrolase family protein, partial [Candidatus Bathyarchaeia archaeon]
TAEIISDGVHVHPALIRLILRCKGLDKIVLVTDAMHAAGVGDGEYAFGGMTVSVKDGIARTLDGVLASSTKPMDYMLKCFCEFTDLPLPNAVQAATLNPSRVIGIDSRKGSLEKGKDADIVTIDENFVVYDVFVMGKRVYQKS